MLQLVLQRRSKLIAALHSW